MVRFNADAIKPLDHIRPSHTVFPANPFLHLMKDFPEHIVHQVAGKAQNDEFGRTKRFRKAYGIGEIRIFPIRIKHTHCEEAVLLDLGEHGLFEVVIELGTEN